MRKNENARTKKFTKRTMVKIKKFEDKESHRKGGLQGEGRRRGNWLANFIEGCSASDRGPPP